MKTLLLTTLLAGIAFGQTTAIDATATGVGPYPSSSFTFNHTVGTGPSKALFVILGGLTDSITSVTYGGVSMTKVADCASGWVCQVWRLLNPTTGTAAVVVNYPSMSQNYFHISAGSISMFGVDQTTPENVVATSSSLCLTSISPTIPNTRLIAVDVNQNGFTTPSTNVAVSLWNNSGGGAEISAGGYSNTVNSGSQNMGWTCDAARGLTILAVNPAVPAPNAVSAISTVRSITGIKPTKTVLKTPVPVIAATQYQGTNSGGDTQFCTWVGSAIRSGPFGGGSILCNWNDAGSGMGCNTSSDACLYAMTSYDPTGVAAATFANVNTYTSYGTSNGDCYDGAGVGTPKTRALFSLPGLLYQPVVCLTHTTYTPRQSGFAVSPDGGAHWCNYKTYLAHTGSPGCDSSNWQANGDFPVDAAGFQWPVTSGSKTGYLAPIDFLCQDNTVNCPVAQGVDPNYVYFFGSATGADMYIHRIAKAADPMLPANLQSFSGGTWVTNNPQAATDVIGYLGSTLNLCCSRMAYISTYGQFVIWGHTGASPMPFATSPTPWGPWTLGTSMAVGDSGFQFPSPIAGLCPRNDATSGKVRCTMFMNGLTSGKDLYIREVTLGDIVPPLMGFAVH